MNNICRSKFVLKHEEFKFIHFYTTSEDYQILLKHFFSTKLTEKKRDMKDRVQTITLKEGEKRNTRSYYITKNFIFDLFNDGM